MSLIQILQTKCIAFKCSLISSRCQRVCWNIWLDLTSLSSSLPEFHDKQYQEFHEFSETLGKKERKKKGRRFLTGLLPARMSFTLILKLPSQAKMHPCPFFFKKCIFKPSATENSWLLWVSKMLMQTLAISHLRNSTWSRQNCT